jgi:hypothetical protein
MARNVEVKARAVGVDAVARDLLARLGAGDTPCAAGACVDLLNEKETR